MNCSSSFCTQLFANRHPKAAGKCFRGNPAPSFSTILSLRTITLVPLGKIRTEQYHASLYKAETHLWVCTFVVFTKSKQVTSLF